MLSYQSAKFSKQLSFVQNSTLYRELNRQIEHNKNYLHKAAFSTVLRQYTNRQSTTKYFLLGFLAKSTHGKAK